MKFCSDCDTKLLQNLKDVGGSWICPNCNPELIVKKRPVYGINYSKTKQCNKGCGTEIYWDEEFKSDSGKFIPIDSRTDRPHQCDGPTESAEPYYPDEIKKYKKQKPELIKPETPASQTPISSDILFDISKIPKSLLNEDKIINEIIQGHKEETLGIIHYENMTAPEPEKIPISSLKDILSENIRNGIQKYGFSGLLPFQEETIRRILKGDNSIISAPTGSGKTEAFTIPILQKISKVKEPGVFALFVYPLNALIDDQVAKISELIDKCGLNSTVGVYSIHGGQNPEYKEKVISDSYKKSVIIATNFDFINYHLILQDKKWRHLFKNAKIIVMDEAHSYTSFHGSNVYHVLKRMKRYMGKVQFVGSSATLDNSREFFSDMFDLPVESFSHIKSKIRRKYDMHMIFIMPRKFGQRTTMERLASICYENSSTQLIFSNSHNNAEFLASNLEETNKRIRIQVHRGGINQRDRKLYELQMKAGELDALSCTPTLELGIDIGRVDVVISAFKNEYDSFVQRIGRAGRMGQKSYAVCVFDPDDAACHYFARHIKDYLAQRHIVSINKENPIISEKHAESAEVEKRSVMTPDKLEFFAFANSVNLRGVSGEIEIYHNSKKIGTRGIPMGYYQLHQDAIYHFNKQTYRVESLTKSQNGAMAYLKESDEKQKNTIPIIITSITEISDDAVCREVIMNSRRIQLRYGLVEINKTVIGYLKGNYNESIEKFETFNGTDIPAWRNFNWRSRHSAVRIDIPAEFVLKIDSGSKSQMTSDYRVHTVIHMLINASKIITKSESNEIDAYYEDGVIYLYDNSSNGFNGYSRMIFDEFEKILAASYTLLNDCDCSADSNQEKTSDGEWEGCPRCTYTTNYCITKNKKLSKKGAFEFFSVFGK